MTPKDLRRWLKRQKLSYRRAAPVLGVHFTTINRWLQGTSPLPRWLPYRLAELDAKERQGIRE